MKKIKGIVKSYDFILKYGFIEGEDKKSYFFHVTDVVKKFKIEPLQTEVLFIASRNERGLCAVAVEEYIVKVTGKFSCDSLNEKELTLTNNKRLEYLEKQNVEITQLLGGLSRFDVSVRKQNGRWIVDASGLIFQEEPGDKGKIGHLLNDVPAGYRNTAKYLINCLQKHLDNFTKDYKSTVKGIFGEEQTQNALKVISLEYPVLHNVRFEVKSDEIEYSAESDTIVITDRAIFVIETKNYGSKRNSICISNDGAWILQDNVTHQSHALPNPYKQSTEHMFVLKNFFANKGVKLILPIQPIIAIANNDVAIKASQNEYAPVMRADMLGTYILQYINSNPAFIEVDELAKIKDILSQANLPPKEYRVIDYYNNVQQICKLIKELHAYWTVAEKKEKQAKLEADNARKAAEERRKREKDRKESAILAWNILAELLYK